MDTKDFLQGMIGVIIIYFILITTVVYTTYRILEFIYSIFGKNKKTKEKTIEKIIIIKSNSKEDEKLSTEELYKKYGPK